LEKKLWALTRLFFGSKKRKRKRKKGNKKEAEHASQSMGTKLGGGSRRVCVPNMSKGS
jgi:hypothetical protein